MSTPNRAQIPISFQYTNADGDLIPIPIATSVLIQNRATGTPATVYAAETGVDIVGFIQTDEGGNIQGWLEQGSYSFSASANLDANPPYAGAQLAWEAVCGDRMKDAEANIATLQGNVTDIDTTTTAIENSAAPIGAVTMYMGTADPADGCWKLCQGGTVVRASFPDFSTWAIANGMVSDATYIHLPDMRQKFPLGKAAAGTGSGALGTTGGNINHTHSVPGLAVPGLSMPSVGCWTSDHYHGLDANGYAAITFRTDDFFGHKTIEIGLGAIYAGGQMATSSFNWLDGSNTGFWNLSGILNYPPALGGRTGVTDRGNPSGATSGGTTGTGTSGGGTTGAADPPFMVVNFIIRVK